MTEATIPDATVDRYREVSAASRGTPARQSYRSQSPGCM